MNQLSRHVASRSLCALFISATIFNRLLLIATGSRGREIALILVRRPRYFGMSERIFSRNRQRSHFFTIQRKKDIREIQIPRAMQRTDLRDSRRTELLMSEQVKNYSSSLMNH